MAYPCASLESGGILNCSLYLLKIMHDYLKEIYFDFCLKNDMPKHNDAYLSADDYLNGNFQLINSQVYWLKNFVRLWNILESTWFDDVNRKAVIELCEMEVR